MFWRLRKPANYEDVVLEGVQIFLRPLFVADAEAMFTFVSDAEVTRYLPWEPAPSVKTVVPFLEEQVGRRKRGESVGFAIVHRETGAVIGSTDLMDLTTKRGLAELGYLLAKPYWGQGIMTEAAALTVQWGFQCLKLNRIVAWADRDNTASIRVMEKLGMTPAGSELRLVKEQTRPYVQYELLHSK
jgi:ribosomal-protein-alanine N-acetyltransferase